MEIKAMRWREFDKLDNKTEYLQAIVDKFGATRGNICDMLGMEVQAFRFYARQRGIDVNYSMKNRYRRCDESKEWRRFVAEILGRQEDTVHYDCFAYRPRKGRKPHNCDALRKLYCQIEDCGFYKPKWQLEKENKKLYGNPRGFRER